MVDAYLKRLRAKAQLILGQGGPDPVALRRQLESPVPDGVDPAFAKASAPVPEAAQLEAVIRWARPVLWINRDAVDESYSLAVAHDVDTALLDQMKRHQAGIDRIIPAVGRIELKGNAHLGWCGTGWLVDAEGDSDIVVTNAHVAEIFARRGTAGFVFRPGIPDFRAPQEARIDFREEIARTDPREFPITEVIWIAPDRGPDVAFLRVARNAGDDRLAPPVPLSRGQDQGLLAVLGYPGKDDRVEYAEKLGQVFGDSFGIKRLALGFATGGDDTQLLHDCSTLPGSSGSLVWNCAEGAAAGLHFAGTAFTTNFAVPSGVLRDLIRRRPWQGRESAGPVPAAAGTVSLTVPLTITLGLGTAAVTAGTAPPRTDRASAEAAARQAEATARTAPGARHILRVAAEYLFDRGEITDAFGVVVAVAPGAPTGHAAYGLPVQIDGTPVAIETADPATIAEEMLGLTRETEAFRKRRAAYTRDLSDPRFRLDPVTDRIRITLHASPEAGWPLLKRFLETNDWEHLTVGMYHVTAPHVVAALTDFARRSRPTPRLTLTLDRQRGDRPTNPDDISDGTKAEDIPERDTLKALETALGERFLYAPASLGGGGLFATAYHIKVAVWTDRLRGNKLEDKAFWLSSGNWQSSNQQPLEIAPEDIPGLTYDDVKDYNREWHAIVAHPGLAKTFREHLAQDQVDNALASEVEAGLAPVPDILVPIEVLPRPEAPAAFRAFAPLTIDDTMTVQPLLTPDNYPEVVLGLIEEAQHRLWIQNQSFNLWKRIEDMPEHFLTLARAIRGKQQAGVDVRILFRNIFGSERNTIRRLKAFGIRTDAGALRFFPKNHTKGMVIDDHATMLGSQNLTAAGTGPNRDASLIVRHPRAVAYFAELFRHDWTQYGAHRAPESAPSRPFHIARGGARPEAARAGYVALSLADFLSEG